MSDPEVLLVPLRDRMLLLAKDAWFDAGGEGDPLQGWVILAMTRAFFAGKEEGREEIRSGLRELIGAARS